MKTRTRRPVIRTQKLLDLLDDALVELRRLKDTFDRGTGPEAALMAADIGGMIYTTEIAWSVLDSEFGAGPRTLDEWERSVSWTAPRPARASA